MRASFGTATPMADIVPRTELGERTEMIDVKLRLCAASIASAMRIRRTRPVRRKVVRAKDQNKFAVWPRRSRRRRNANMAAASYVCITSRRTRPYHWRRSTSFR